MQVDAVMNGAALDANQEESNDIPSPRDFKDVHVKVHIRKPEKDAWTDLGRGIVSQEFAGHSSRVGLCSMNHVFNC